MTDDTIRDVLDRYERAIPDHMHPGRMSVIVDEELRHLLTMIPKMRFMLDESIAYGVHDGLQFRPDRAMREKLMRWLGFMQGALWDKGIYTIDEMREHNKPTGETFRERQP